MIHHGGMREKGERDPFLLLPTMMNHGVVSKACPRMFLFPIMSMDDVHGHLTCIMKKEIQSYYFKLIIPAVVCCLIIFILEKMNKDAQKRVGKRSYPIIKKISVKQSEGPFAKRPALPKPSKNCRRCPPGEHIGLDPDKRYCHAD